MNKERLLIIDGLNLFIRSFVVNPSVNTNGESIGGIVGFLSSLQKYIVNMQPSMVYIVWDGRDGSAKRRKINPEYKGNRKPLRLNRSVEYRDEQEELKNKIFQQVSLIEYLNELPVIQFMFDSVEADDIIAYICEHYLLKDKIKFIVSSDKDFIQLCRGNTILYRPIKDEMLTESKVVEEFGIHPNNFALAKALSGDSSDNIKGLDGVGLKSIAKRFPRFAEPELVTIDELWKDCDGIENKLKIHTSIVDNKQLIKENYDLVQLYVPKIGYSIAKLIDQKLEIKELKFSKHNILAKLRKDGIGYINLDSLFAYAN